ncbi:MAG: hypothetical protein DRQ47_00780 [Gammaproteobacteria bacterium]|nr:MAG: hypothetical protein DRQ47_00780 [Gammaproteobacteria bacterium]
MGLTIKSDCILVLDVGKTHTKVSLVNLSSGNLETSVRLTNSTIDTSYYRAIDVDAIWEWFIQQIKILNQSFAIKQITTTTHGAAAVVVAGNELLFPVIDYEADIYEYIDQQYNEARPDFLETGSLNLGQGLNLGRQLFYLQQTYPAQWEKAETIMLLPQYFCWKLTGIAVTELTSLGCHTDLWNIKEGKYSSLVNQCDWLKLFPNIKKTGEKLGPVCAGVAEETGLETKTLVLNGIHDSNASLVPYLAANKGNLNILSTGTWAVFNAIQKATSHQLSTTSDKIMHSVDYQNNPVLSMRFMGGREWELIQQNKLHNTTFEDIEQIINMQCYPIPAFAPTGPFAGIEGAIIGKEKPNENQLSALATIYLVLMSRYCLDELDCSGDIIVEGSFTKNLEYLQLLQQLSTEQEILYSSDPSGTTFGACRLTSDAINWPTIELMPVVNKSIIGFNEYYDSWKQLLQNIC